MFIAPNWTQLKFQQVNGHLVSCLYNGILLTSKKEHAITQMNLKIIVLSESNQPLFPPKIEYRLHASIVIIF